MVNRGSVMLGIALALLTLLTYWPSFNNGFTNWDDEIYVLYNPLIRDLSLDGVIKIFATPSYMGNYHPVTLLSYALDYKLSGLDPRVLHATSLLLHIASTVLVFIFISLLFGDRSMGFLVGLLFGIHPMHVESVCWLSARKDVLYAFFFLASLISFTASRRDTTGGRWYGVSLICFVLSLLSKATAVSLPLVLLLLCYYSEGRLSRQSLRSTVPYFLLAIIFGIVAVIAQQSAKAIDHGSPFDAFQRILIGSYGALQYILKLLVPANLSALYFYPRSADGSLPPSFYLSFVILAGVVAVTLIARKRAPTLFWGVGFFALTIALVLQVVPVGRAIMADRYSYIPSVGIFFILALGAKRLQARLTSGSPWQRYLLPVALATYVIWLCAGTWDRCKVWESGITLWSDVIEKVPTDPGLYNSRGLAYLGAGATDRAMADFNLAIALKPDYRDALVNRGNARYVLQEYQSALSDFSSAIQHDSTFSLAYYNRGNTYARIERNDLAIADYTSAITLKPDYAAAFFNRGVAKLVSNDTASACGDFRKAMEMGLEISDSTYRTLCAR